MGLVHGHRHGPGSRVLQDEVGDHPGEPLEQRDRRAGDQGADRVGQRGVVDRVDQLVAARRSASRSSMSRSTTKRWPSSRSASWTPWCAEGLEPRMCTLSASPLIPRPPRPPRPAGRRPSRARRGPAGPPPRARPRPAPRRRTPACARPRAGRAAAEHALARHPDQHRAPQLGEPRHAGQQGEVVLQRLAEADAGVEDDPLLGDPGIDGSLQARGQVVPHLRHDVLVRRVLLHRARVAAHVHEADVGAALGHQRQQARVEPAGGDVVDEREAGVEGGLGHRGQRGVDRQGSGGVATRSARSTPERRASCSSASTGSAPGRVLSAPTSQIAAPSSAIRSSNASAPSGSIGPAPPQEESGVTLRIPMTQGGLSQRAGRPPGKRTGAGPCCGRLRPGRPGRRPPADSRPGPTRGGRRASLADCPTVVGGHTIAGLCVGRPRGRSAMAASDHEVYEARADGRRARALAATASPFTIKIRFAGRADGAPEGRVQGRRQPLDAGDRGRSSPVAGRRTR